MIFLLRSWMLSTKQGVLNILLLIAALGLLVTAILLPFSASVLSARAESEVPGNLKQTTEESQSPPASGDVILTVNTGTEPSINVRSGPGIDYELLGTLLEGEQVKALGRSPGGDWVMVEFPSAQDGRGWVYAYLVTLSGEVSIVEPPPTPTPRVTPTIDKTLAAQFIKPVQPTRQPTFTPPPPLVIPTFQEESTAQNSVSTEYLYLAIGIGIVGLLGIVISTIRGK